MSTDMDRLPFERDLETPAGEGSGSPVPAGPGAPTAADAPDRTPEGDGSTAPPRAGERGSCSLGWTLRDLRRYRTEGRRAQERLARLELKWARDPGLTAGVLVDRVLAGAYGEAAEVAGTLMTPVRGAEGAEWAAGWVAARELITLRLLALAEEAAGEQQSGDR
ncbi:hypothetical protein ACIQVA_33975 [Streptomyces microflavus]|uniref:hypothetical protein n=1 Tax=Streptomyces microflavus TaxID=1919 RepID=UPI0037FCF1D7